MGRNIVVAAAGRKPGKSLLCEALAGTMRSAGLKCACYKLRSVAEMILEGFYFLVKGSRKKL
ncbi:hypothetical protein CSA37_10980 [Candidatus Fermentibacteria bacterium]|nr:MAG: hypothetical protein CSA37_10980 [Candidatus Fermentibacteria bacterium]